jgi:hypothetical protein
VYYLAIEGGTNRTSGLRVEGVAAREPRADREGDVPRVHLDDAVGRGLRGRARVTVQSARDLYGAGSPAERALIQAWTAVGVP